MKTTCLNTFLNSLFNTSSAPSVWMNVSDYYSEVGSNKGRMPELVLFHGIFFLRLCLRGPSLNNAVQLYANGISQVLITTARRLPKRKIGYVGFIGFFVSVFGYVFFFETASPQMRVDFITEVIWIVIRIQQKVLVATILHQNRVGISTGNEIWPLPCNNALHLHV